MAEVVKETLEEVATGADSVVENVTEAVVNATTGKIPSTPEGMAIAYGSLVIMACLPIFFGAFRSIKSYEEQKAQPLIFLNYCLQHYNYQNMLRKFKHFEQMNYDEKVHFIQNLKAKFRELLEMVSEFPIKFITDCNKIIKEMKEFIHDDSMKN